MPWHPRRLYIHSSTTREISPTDSLSRECHVEDGIREYRIGRPRAVLLEAGGPQVLVGSGGGRTATE
jgi:hypothetical protein